MYNAHRLLSGVSFTITVLLALYIRLYLLKNQFTHVDDIIVLSNALEWQEKGIISVLKGIYFTGLTYAPFQLLLSNICIFFANSFEWKIILGRLPSFVIGILTIITVGYYIRVRFKNITFVLLGMIISALSWELMIYSAQMEPYVISVLFLTIFMIMTHVIDNDGGGNRRQYILFGVITGLAVISQFQLIPFVVAFWFAAVFYKRKMKKDILYGILVCALFFLPIIIKFIYYLLVHHMNFLKLGVNWNVGIDKIFLFSIPSGSSIDIVEYILNYFINNSFLLYRYFILPDIYISNYVSVLLMIISVYGLYWFIKAKETVEKDFVIVFMIFSFILILSQKLTLGPSRHCMIYIPVMIYFIIIGLENISKHFIDIVTHLLCLFIIVGNFYIFQTELTQRNNMLTQDYIEGIIREYNPVAVIASKHCIIELNILDPISDYKLINHSLYGELIKENKKIKKGDNVIFVARGRSMEKYELAESLERINSSDKHLSMDDFVLIHKEEMLMNEVEYATRYYSNNPNGRHIYVYSYNR